VASSVGDGSFAEYMHPSLTTAMAPIHELGKRAAELLIQQITGVVKEPRTVAAPWELRVRESTLARKPARHQ
jgi:DNA-binding LacI/PurR family transcriptional regulator